MLKGIILLLFSLILLIPLVNADCTNEADKILCTGTINNISIITAEKDIWLIDGSSSTLGTINTTKVNSYINISNFNLSKDVLRIESTTKDITNLKITQIGGNGEAGISYTTCKSGIGRSGGDGSYGGESRLLFVGKINKLENFTLYSQSGSGGNGGRGENCGGNYCQAGRGGKASDAGSVYLIIGEINTSNIINSNITLQAGAGGSGGEGGHCSCGGSYYDNSGSGGNGGHEGSIFVTIGNQNLNYNSTYNQYLGIKYGYYGAGPGGKRGIDECTYYGSSGTEGSTGSGTFKLTSIRQFSMINYLFNFSIRPLTSSYINLTDTTLNKFGVFNGSGTDKTIYIHCNAPSLEIGNDTALSSNWNFSNCLAYMSGNVTYKTYSQFFSTESINITINSPNNNTFSSSNLVVNVTITDSESRDLKNVSFYLNNSLHTNLLNITSGSTILFNATLNEGNHTFYIKSYSNNTLDVVTATSNTYTYTKDSIYPIINLNNPNVSGLSSPFNLTLNLSFDSRTLNTTNISIYYSNNTLFKELLNTINTTQIVNFTEQDRYIINITAVSKSNLTSTNNTFFFFDNTSPIISLSVPNGTYTTQVINLTTSIIDNSSLICYYRVTDSNLNPQIASTSYNCLYVPFTLSTIGNYIIYVNATDGKKTTELNASFNITQLVVVPESTGGGGGGGSIAEKKECKIEVSPETIYLSSGKQLQEIIIENKDQVSYLPIIEIKDTFTTTNGLSKSISITNIPSTTLPNTKTSFGVKFNGKGETGEVSIILSSQNCKDIPLSIIINQGILERNIQQIFNPSQSLLLNVYELLSSPIINLPYLLWLKTYMVGIITAILLFLITYRKLEINNERGSKFKVLLILGIDLVVTFVILTIIKLALVGI